MGSRDRRFDALVGVGGIGSGTCFAIEGNATLGREESRGGRLLDQRDYCKLHIVCHYVRALLGPSFEVLPVGLVGDDETGRRLLAEMADAGLGMQHVAATGEAPTLWSFCLVYPDGSGGNLTLSDSAAARLDPARVARAEPDLRAWGPRGIALALPEVSLAARSALLRMATPHGSFRVASFTSRELGVALEDGLLRDVDLVALNRDEAGALAATPAAAVERVLAENPTMLVSITAGREGSWAWDGDELRLLPAPAVEVASTAGAGDAHLAGLIVGLAAGLDVPGAHELAGLVAAMSVTSTHTIDERLRRASLARFAAQHAIALSRPVESLLFAGVAGLERTGLE